MISEFDKIILKVMGTRFCDKIGMRNVLKNSAKNSIIFNIGQNVARINKVEISLTDMNLFDIEFIRFSPKQLKSEVIYSVKGIEAKNLRNNIINHIEKA